jgi:CIC family chloride channel protein
MGYFVPEVLGVGYGTVDRVLDGEVVLRFVVLLAVLKIFATAICYASGNAGGIFGPSMFIGAMMGAAVGRVAEFAMPGATGGPGAYALVGMGTAFAGIIRTPLTSVIMIFEVTRDYSIIVPLMISNLIAFYVSRRLQHEPIYEALARQDGMHLPTAAFREHALRLRVHAALREAPEAIDGDLEVRHALARFDRTTLDSIPVQDSAGFLGMISREELQRAMQRGNESLPVRGVIEQLHHTSVGGSEFAHVHGDQPLGQALARMGSSTRTVLPVVSRANVRILLGIVTLPDVLRAFGVADSGEAAVGDDNDDD